MVCFDRAQDINRDYAAIWSNKGPCLAELGRVDEALACFDRALEINPKCAKTWHNKGNLLAKKLGRPDEALTCFDQALALNPDDTTALKARAKALTDLARHESQAETMTPPVSVTSVSPTQHPRAAGSESQQKSAASTVEMMAYYDRSLLIIDMKQGVQAATSEANMHALLGRHEEAIKCFDQLLSSSPRDAYLWCNKAITFATLGRHEEAIVCCDHALALKTNFPAALSSKGISLANLDRWEEALVCFDQLLTHNAMNNSVWINRGIVLAAQGRVDEALACYDRVLKRNPRNAKVWFNKAIVEEISGRARDAINSYKRFLAFASKPDTKWVEYAQGQIDLLESR